MMNYEEQTMVLYIDATTNIEAMPMYNLANVRGRYKAYLVGNDFLFSAGPSQLRLEYRSPLTYISAGNIRYCPAVIPGDNALPHAPKDPAFTKNLCFDVRLDTTLPFQIWNVTNNRALNAANDNFTGAYLYFKLEKIED